MHAYCLASLACFLHLVLTEQPGRPEGALCAICLAACCPSTCAGDAAVKYAGMLDQSLRTIAPRVAFYQQQRPGQPLPSTRQFQSGDKVFCQEQGFDPAQFAAFKAAWLASEEGRAVCRHEKA